MTTHSSFENNAMELYAPLGYIEEEEEERDANTNVTELSDSIQTVMKKWMPPNKKWIFHLMNLPLICT
ncbi:hypothetical protein J1N35_043291 [Gossypium stocksii]|uniref:Uncharacterized protein n=1 Tax=Gossypium stocksii TaxID=47602 RepID=A0A9D3ZES0_9ROSI|nr:hypothetical protein J1N35_043291 [Gossypium stocksii]